MSDFTDNAERQRFEMKENGALVFATYRRDGDTVVIPHVEAAPELRGKGAAARLMTQIAEHLRTQGLKARPYCSYAVAWFRRNPQYRDVLED